MSKRIMALLLSVLMLLTAAAGCAAPAEEKPAAKAVEGELAPAESAAPLQQEPEPITIEVLIADDSWHDDWDILEKRFEEHFGNTDLVRADLSGDRDDYIQKRIKARDLPDIILCGSKSRSIVNLNSRDLLTDLSAHPLAANMQDAYKKAYTIDNRLIGICTGARTVCMVCNMALLHDAGWETPPADWDEFLKCCGDLREKVPCAPLGLAGIQDSDLWSLFELILANTCGDELGQGGYEQKFFSRAFDFAAWPQIGKRLDAIAPYLVEGAGKMTMNGLESAMKAGEVAMGLVSSDELPDLVRAAAAAAGSEELAQVILPPFGDSGKVSWISALPGDALCLIVDNERTEEEQKRVEDAFAWFFEPENYAVLQDRLHVMPVTSNMADGDVLLPLAGEHPVIESSAHIEGSLAFGTQAHQGLRELFAGKMTGKDLLAEMSKYGFIAPNGLTAEGLVEFVKKCKEVPHVYSWDTYGEYLTDDLLDKLSHGHPDWFTKDRLEARRALVGQGVRSWDCAGLIDSYVWNDYTDENPYFWRTDIPYYTKPIEQMIRTGQIVCGPIGTLPERPGLVLFVSGHVGVYIGNGRALECTHSEQALMRDALEREGKPMTSEEMKLFFNLGGIIETNVSERPWTHWVEWPAVQY